MAAQPSESLESAGRLIDQHLKADHSYVELSGQLRIASHQHTTYSGQTDTDYPSLSSSLPALAGLPYLGPVTHTPLPPELLQEFDNLQCNCAMGLLPEVRRAWLTIDSTIYMWNYEDGKDLAYFDGLNEVILAAGLVLPRPGVFQQHIQFLLCLTTAVEIVILGVSFTASATDPYCEMHLQPEPLFHIPSDNVSMLAVSGTPQGRLFLAGKDGCLYEIVYQAEDGWFSRKCRKVNHSVSRLSFLVPSFLSFSEEDSLIQITVDSSRQILYTRSEKNTIHVYDLGGDGSTLSSVASMTMDHIAHTSAVALRTADKSLVRPIVQLSVIPSSESSTLHMLAITKAGVRLYFTTTPNGVVARPSLLALVHARLPPGFSPSSAAQRPGNSTHQAFYRKGLLVLSSSQTEEKDMLWMVDSDMFPFAMTLMESHVSYPLEGRTWAIGESIEAGELEAVGSPRPLPPMVVSQHAQPPRRMVLLTTQGSYLVTRLRPVDQLQYLLEVSKGANSDTVEAFFHLHRDTQACATSLILATGSNQQLAAWATEALFKYGGEPHFVFPTTLGPANQAIGGSPAHFQATPTYQAGGQYPSSPAAAQGSHPRVVGPASQVPGPALGQYGMQTSGALGRALLGPEVQLSGKHNGLCRYLTRLLSPLWYEPVTVPYKPPGSNTEQFASRYTPEEVSVFAEQLNNLKAFLERNPQLFDSTADRFSSPASSNLNQRLLQFMRPEGMPTESPAHVQQSLLNKYKADAYLLERSSLTSLHLLVEHSCQCLSLLKLLCEHQLHLTVQKLSQEQQQELKAASFRSLVVCGQKLTSALIASLLTRYAGDTGLTDSLTARLRQMAPALFSQDDAIISKAQELVTMATVIQSRYEQLSMLRDSLKRYSQVTHQLDLSSVCSQYKTLRYYEGVVELTLCVAGRKDPQNLGLHYYKSGQPHDDVNGQRAFIEREQCYSVLTFTLGQLLSQDHTPAPPPSVPLKAGPPSPRAEEGAKDPLRDFEEMLTLALRSEDELFHVTLYSWLISVGLGDRLVEIQSAFVEDFLKHTAAIQADNLPILDLLWKHYEKARNYGSAARILDKLADREGPELSLDQRVEYLSRAVVSAKSCNLATSASTAGEFLHHLEEKMEVARIQLSIVETLRLLPGSADITAAIGLLNARLMDISTLYGDFAEPFGLAESKLAIVHCAGHYDPTLVESLWRDIIDNELHSSARSPAQTRMHGMRTKLLVLGQIYARSERFFPLSCIVELLERHSCQLQWDVHFVAGTLQELGSSLPSLFSIYDRLFKAKDPFWQSVNQPLHVLMASHSLLSSYANTPSLVAAYQRPSFNSVVLDAIDHYLVELQTMSPSTRNMTQTITDFRALQMRVQRIL